jgi:hypothetical protein
MKGKDYSYEAIKQEWTGYPDAFPRAVVLVNTDPIPLDVWDQLDELKSQISDPTHLDQFEMFYEAALAASDTPLSDAA